MGCRGCAALCGFLSTSGRAWECPRLGKQRSRRELLRPAALVACKADQPRPWARQASDRYSQLLRRAPSPR